MVPPTDAPPSRMSVPTSVKLAYGIGDIAISVNAVLFGLFVMFFYVSVMKLQPTLVGIGAALGLAWDAVIDPYIGYRSDRSSGRWGRRHGYMLVGAVFIGPSFYLLLSPPRDLGATGTVAWLLLTSMAFRFAHALYRIPYLSLGAELSRDYHERTVIVGIRSFFGLCGTLIAATLSFLLFFPNEGLGTDPKLNYAGYPRMGATFGLLMTLTGLIAVVGTPRIPVPTPSAVVTAAGGRWSFLRGFALAARNSSFRVVWSSFTLCFLAIVLNAAVALLYFTWYVRIHDSAALSRIQAAFYVGALAGLGLWVLGARRMEKRGLCVIATVATATLMTLAAVLLGEGRPLGTGNATPLLVGHLLGGAFAGALWVIPASMMADVADEDELLTGARREGLLFGLLNFGEKVAAGVALLLGGMLLDLFVGVVGGEPKGEQAVARIGVLYGLVPGGLALSAAVILGWYRLDRRTVERTQRILASRRQSESS